MRSLKIGLMACIASAALLSALSAQANDKLNQAPAPDWVKPVPMPTTSSEATDAPIAVLLSDVQARFTPEGTSFFTELAMRIQTAQGLPAGQFAIAWDPSTDDVTIHSFRILRGDKVIDVLANQSFTVVRRETNLDMAMLDGVLTGVLQPEGLQVGDIVSYSFTRTRKIQALGAHNEALLNDGLSILTARYVRRAIWDKRVPMAWRASDDMQGVTFNHVGPNNEVVFDTKDYMPPKPVDNAPIRDQIFGNMQFSDYGTWQNFSALVAPLYGKAAQLKPDSPLHDEVAKIKAASSDPEVQAMLALQLVESQVRYVFLGMNESGIVPAEADATWTRRFGDCKGKSTLLTALLRELGIKAEPALVSTGLGDGLDQRLPMAAYFDHVIVRAEIGGKVYWLDGTRYGDKHLSDLVVPGYEWALPIRDGGAPLEALKEMPLDKPETEQNLQLDASAGLDVPAKVHAERLYRGDVAIQSNANLSNMSNDERDKALKSLWTDDYDWLTPVTVSASFDADKREERIIMDGTAKMDWDASLTTYGRRYEADSYGLGWTSELKRDPGPHQNDPVALHFPGYYLDRETIILPDHGKDFTLIGAPVEATLYGKAFHRTLSLKDGVFTVESSTRSLVPEISYEQAMKDQPAVKTMAKGGVYIQAPSTYKATKAELDAIKPSDGDASAHREEAQKLLGNGQTQAGIAELDAAIKLKPDDAELLQMRGAAKLGMEDFTAALTDFDASLKLNPVNWQANNGRAAALIGQKKYADAIDAYSQSLELQSDNDTARSGRIAAYVMNKQPEKALSDAQLFVRLKPDSAQAQWILGATLEENRRLPEAMDAYRKAVDMAPGNVTVVTQFAGLLGRCQNVAQEACLKQHDEALALYDKIIALEPSAYAYTARSQARRPDQFDLKKQDIDAALAMQPDSNFALTARAALYLSHKDYDLAIADATQVIDHPHENFDNDQAYEIRIYAYDAQKKYDLELKDLDGLTARNPKDAQWLNESAWTRATHNMELDKALADANAAVKLSPDSSAIFDTRAFIELRMGQLDAALADYDQALKLAAEQADSLYGRGLVKRRKGLNKDGDADLAAARKLAPNIDKVFANYGLKP